MDDEIKTIKEKVNVEELQEKLSKLSSQLDQTKDFQSDDYVKTIKDFNETKLLIETFTKLLDLDEKYKLNIEILNDPELGVLAKEDNESLKSEINKTIQMIKMSIQKPLKNDEKKAIFEIRPGVGGAEASLFAEDLYRMYSRYCSNQKMKIEVFTMDYNQEGGIKEAVFLINEPGSYGKFRFEGGVHRVQRVPKTEALGRIHTSTASVAVLPQFESKDVSINPKDLRIDVYRSSGPGGQSVNTTDSAVRITHIPTKIVVTCQNGRSQIQNKETAMNILASKLQEIEEERRVAEENKIRGESVADSERSSKIRTYNYPQGRITDHRIGKSWFNIEPIMNGEIDDIIASTNQILREQ